jgi:hypothetical protein
MSAEDDPNKLLALTFAWMDGRILDLTPIPGTDRVLFRVRAEDGHEEKQYVARAHFSEDKFRWTRFLFDFDQKPPWSEFEAKALALFPDLDNLSDRYWNKIRKQAGYAAPKGRPLVSLPNKGRARMWSFHPPE